MDGQSAVKGVREFLERIHAVLNRLDASPLTTIAAVHGVCFGGGFELALVCDLIIADKMARFCFPELRLGLIPGFGGRGGSEREPGEQTRSFCGPDQQKGRKRGNALAPW
jgi:enoyl-CoA hydratase/carnithine racemase